MVCGRIFVLLQLLLRPVDGAKRSAHRGNAHLERRGRVCERETTNLMISPRLTLLCSPVCVMLRLVLSRTCCQVVTEVNRSAYPTFSSGFRAFTTSAPTWGEAADNGKPGIWLHKKLGLPVRAHLHHNGVEMLHYLSVSLLSACSSSWLLCVFRWLFETCESLVDSSSFVDMTWNDSNDLPVA